MTTFTEDEEIPGCKPTFEHVPHTTIGGNIVDYFLASSRFPCNAWRIVRWSLTSYTKQIASDVLTPLTGDPNDRDGNKSVGRQVAAVVCIELILSCNSGERELLPPFERPVSLINGALPLPLPFLSFPNTITVVHDEVQVQSARQYLPRCFSCHRGACLGSRRSAGICSFRTLG